VARDIVKAADITFFIGCKAGQLSTFSYRLPARDAQIIHLDNDPEEIGRNYPNSIPLVADARVGLQVLLAELGDGTSNVAWDFEPFKEQHKSWYDENTNPATPANKPVRPPTVMEVVNQHLKDDDIVVCDASLSSGWAAAYLNFKQAGRRMIAPRGLAGLGWGSPAAIGASLARKQKNRIIQFTGDGGFGYSLQEIEVMARFKLPIVTVVFNNDTLGWIKHVQKDHYDQNYVSTDFSHVNFATVAEGFGAKGYTANTLDEFTEYFTAEQNPDGPVVIEIISDQWESPVLGIS
jgi:acetolactate synthase-1/2/3 large subunit